MSYRYIYIYIYLGDHLGTNYSLNWKICLLHYRAEKQPAGRNPILYDFDTFQEGFQAQTSLPICWGLYC